jgi:hypothetical protein
MNFIYNFWFHVSLLLTMTVVLYNFNFFITSAAKLRVIILRILEKRKNDSLRYLSLTRLRLWSFRHRVEGYIENVWVVFHTIYVECKTLWEVHISLSASAFIASLKRLKYAVKEYDSRFEGAAKRNPKTAFMLGEFFSRPVGWMMGILLMAYQGEKVRGFVDWVVDGVRVYGDCVIEVVFIYGEFVIEVVRVYVNCLIEVLRVFIAWVISFFF